MSLTEWLFGNKTPDDRDDGDDRPPKPDDEHRRREIDVNEYEATVEYRNGDSETFGCYGVVRPDDRDVLKFKTDPEPGVKGLFGRDELAVEYDHRVEHYETLDREPVLEEVGSATMAIKAEFEYEWGYDGYPMVGFSKEWVSKPKALELTIITNDD